MPLKFNGSLQATQLFEALCSFAADLDNLCPSLRPCCFVSVTSNDGFDFPSAQNFVCANTTPAALKALVLPAQTSVSVTFYLECAEICVTPLQEQCYQILDALSSKLHLFLHPYLPWGATTSTEPFVIASPAGFVRCVLTHGQIPQFQLELEHLDHTKRALVEQAWTRALHAFLLPQTSVMQLDLDSFFSASGHCAQPSMSQSAVSSSSISQGSILYSPPSEQTFSLQALVPDAQVAEQIGTVQQAMKEGECYLLNLSLRAQVPCSAGLFTMASLLREWVKRKSRFGICYSSQSCKILSFSPERFVAVEAGWILAEPIKGTNSALPGCELGLEQAQQLWNSHKERHEQTLVVDLLRNDLNCICEPGSVDVVRPFFARRTQTLLQMQSFVVGKVNAGLSLSRFFLNLLPAGSVTGTPKKRVCEIISEVELTPRGYYTGLFAVLEQGRCAESVLLIRTLFGNAYQNHNECTVGVGAGITTLSDAHLEIAEFKLKLLSFAALGSNSEKIGRNNAEGEVIS